MGIRRVNGRHCRALFVVGALCWNIASQKLPTVILGPLIVFETLARLLYTFLMRQSVPPLLTACGIALLVVGVVIAVRAKPEKPMVVPASEGELFARRRFAYGPTKP